MRRMLALMALVVTMLGLASAAPASAATPNSTALSCQILPNRHNGAEVGTCYTDYASQSYSIEYAMYSVNVIGWDLPPAGSYTLLYGCYAGSPTCGISVTVGPVDRSVAVTVHYQLIATQAVRPGLVFSFSSTATAEFAGVCGQYFC